ncbi:unnamed protein product [Effrenium voratum]|nr:unnamed protein product [Effrenium voratum]
MDDPGTQNGDNAQMASRTAQGDREDGGGDPWAGDNPARRDPWSDYVAPAPQAEALEAAPRDEPHDREARDWWDTSGTWGWSDWSWHSEEWGNSKWGSSASRWENAKPDLSDPPPWPGWSHYRLWKKAVERWNRSTDIPVWRSSDKLLKLLDWDLQGRFEYVPEAELTSDKYLDLIFQVLDVLAGEREGAEKRRAVRAALYEAPRRSEESYSQYILRREQQFQAAEKFMPIPNEIKAFMTEENAGLSKQGLQNLRTLTQGASDFGAVRRALQVLDLDEESITRPRAHFVDSLDTAPETYLEGVEDDCEDTEDDSEDQRETLKEISDLDLTEHEAQEVLLAMDRDDHHGKRKKKTSHREKVVRKKRISPEELKKITKCANCGERGHRLCLFGHVSGHNGGIVFRAQVVKSKSNLRNHRVGTVTTTQKERTRDTFGEEKPSKRIKRADETDGPDNATASKTTEQIVEFVDDEYIYLKEEQVFDPPPEHQAVVDLGAGQDLIGHPAYKRLQEKLAESGLRTVEFQEDGPSPIGIGGKATPVCSALIPCMLGGTPGIVKVLVVEEDVPHLLSIGLLEHAGAMINTADDSIVFQEFGSKDKTRRLRSGHRTLQIATWSGKNFPVPAEIAQQYSLKEGDFQFSPRKIAWRTMVVNCIRKMIRMIYYPPEIMGQDERRRECLLRMDEMEESLEGYKKPKAPGPSPGKICPHPTEYVRKGANQWGTWVRCTLCKAKLGYTPYGKNNPPPNKNAPKKSAQVLYVPSGPASSSVEVPALAKAVATAVKTAIGEAQKEARNSINLQLQQATYQNQMATHQQLVDNLRGISQMIETNASWMRIDADPPAREPQQ